MTNKLMSVAVAAALLIGGIANANPSRMAAEQALNTMSKTDMGRKFADMLNVKIPKGELAVAQREELISKVEAALKSNKEATGVLSQLEGATAGMKGAQLERATFTFLNNNPVVQRMIVTAASTSVSNKVVNQTTASTAKEVLACEGGEPILIPPGARKAGLLGIKCDQALSAENKQVAIDMFTQMGADGVASWDKEAQQMVEILVARNPLGKSTPAEARTAAVQGAQTLCTNCLECAPGLKNAVASLKPGI